jgi:hypothetical protein
MTHFIAMVTTNFKTRLNLLEQKFWDGRVGFMTVPDADRRPTVREEVMPRPGRLPCNRPWLAMG